MNTQASEIAVQIVIKSNYLSLATASLGGDPWVVPLFYNYDPDQKAFYWLSPVTSFHSIQLTKNPRFAATIFDSSVPAGHGEGVYIIGEAQELKDKEAIENGLDIYFSGKYPVKNKRADVGITDFSSPAPRRIYKAIAKKAWLLQYPEVFQSPVADTRIEIEL